ncbi:phage head closure protein [Andreprevotia chitinilytica]|uniref:phage head closure protein n=1 Tax=Andreprevotia chitinilytica TaxID=396808 RepID=UPI00055036D2|nr:phage head closure protein [Andreprevotia chitinilytica]
MRAGKLNKRITLQRRSAGKDEYGAPLNRWESLTPIWADIRFTSGKEAIAAGAEASTAAASIRIRYRTGITAAMRVVYGTMILNIKAVLPDLARKEYLDLVCETDPKASL